MTYSLATLGTEAGYRPSPPQTLTVDDLAAGQVGAQAASMSSNAQFLCKRRDGSSAYYTIDQQRSTPGNLVLQPVL
jgi:hypothetical protein